MKNEAIQRNLPPEGYEGGLILDELSIQSDLQFYSKNEKKYLVCFTEVLDAKLMETIHSGKKEIKLATHVLQFVLFFRAYRVQVPSFSFSNNTSYCS